MRRFSPPVVKGGERTPGMGAGGGGEVCVCCSQGALHRIEAIVDFLP